MSDQLIAGLMSMRERLKLFGDQMDGDITHIDETIAHIRTLKKQVALLATPQSSAPVVGELVDKDHARLALFKAIEAVAFGNKTDDKLILDNLRDAGFWIAKMPSESALTGRG